MIWILIGAPSSSHEIEAVDDGTDEGMADNDNDGLNGSEGANDAEGVDVGSADNEGWNDDDGDDEGDDVVVGQRTPRSTPGASDSKPPPSNTESLSYATV